MVKRAPFLSIKTTGFREFDIALRQLPKATGKAVVRRALTKSLKPVALTARALAPRGPTGNLIASIKVSARLKKSQQGGRDYGVTVYCGTSWPTGAHGHLVAFGTDHTSPNDFFEQAWRENKTEVLTTLRVEVWKSIAKTARTLARKAQKGTLTRTAIRHFGQ